MKKIILSLILLILIGSIPSCKREGMKIFPLYPYSDSLVNSSAPNFLPLDDSLKMFNKYYIVENYNKIKDTSDLSKIILRLFDSEEEKRLINKTFAVEYFFFKADRNLNRDSKMSKSDVSFTDIANKQICRYRFVNHKLFSILYFDKGEPIFPVKSYK